MPVKVDIVTEWEWQVDSTVEVCIVLYFERVYDLRIKATLRVYRNWYLKVAWSLVCVNFTDKRVSGSIVSVCACYWVWALFVRCIIFAVYTLIYPLIMQFDCDLYIKSIGPTQWFLQWNIGSENVAVVLFTHSNKVIMIWIKQMFATFIKQTQYITDRKHQLTAIIVIINVMRFHPMTTLHRLTRKKHRLSSINWDYNLAPTNLHKNKINLKNQKITSKHKILQP